MNRSPFASATVALSAAVFLALAVPISANAHVRVTPNTANPGAYATLVFKVPNESATNGTTRLVIDLPGDTPFASAMYEPVPGWTGEIVSGALPKPASVNGTTLTEAPTTIVFTANPGVEIAPHQFQQFVVSIGPVPDTGAVLFPAHQTYSDGTVVDWADAADPSGTEPAHPAPALYIRDAPPTHAHHGVVSAAETPKPHAASSDSSSGPVTLGLAIGAIVLAMVGCVLALAAFTVARRPRDTDRAKR